MFRRVANRLTSTAAGTAAASASASLPESSAFLSQEQIDALSPRSMVEILDRFIVGQTDAKKAVAISLRNRWRRRQITDKGLQGDIVPKNILMIGPTGVGKTEISRRMARITDAPFIKVEATKYTEVGFKGKDVESIIEDLYASAKSKTRRRLERDRDEEATKAAYDILYSAFMRQLHVSGAYGTAKAVAAQQRAATATKPSAAIDEDDEEDDEDEAPTAAGTTSSAAAAAADGAAEKITFAKFVEKLTAGELDNEMVTIDVTVTPPERKGAGGDALGGMGLFLFGGAQPKVVQQVRHTMAEALPLAKREVLNKLIDDAQVGIAAKALCEQEGIVFLDEIDKVVSDSNSSASDVSSMGVQQDLLPLIEGSTVTLKDGTTVETDNILFICSGAFHLAKPSDMIAELQGRLPVRVELQPLTEKEFRRILVEPKFNLLAQQRAMMKTEGVDLEFADSGIDAIAAVAKKVNAGAQNIGARRLHTIIELVMDEYSFDFEKYVGKKVVIDDAYVNEKTKNLTVNVDLSKYIL